MKTKLVKKKNEETRDKVIVFSLYFVLVLFSFENTNRIAEKNKQSTSHNIIMIVKNSGYLFLLAFLSFLPSICFCHCYLEVWRQLPEFCKYLVDYPKLECQVELN